MKFKIKLALFFACLTVFPLLLTGCGLNTKCEHKMQRIVSSISSIGSVDVNYHYDYWFCSECNSSYEDGPAQNHAADTVQIQKKNMSFTTP